MVGEFEKNKLFGEPFNLVKLIEIDLFLDKLFIYIYIYIYESNSGQRVLF
jgi:hypothetical protein